MVVAAGTLVGNGGDGVAVAANDPAAVQQWCQ